LQDQISAVDDILMIYPTSVNEGHKRPDDHKRYAQHHAWRTDYSGESSEEIH
jgi:hypothetical protein